MSKPTAKERWKNLGRILIGKGLPTVAATVGGPAGAVVGNIIADIVGANRDDPDAIEEALATANPETLIRLREIEANLRTQQLETVRNLEDNLTERLQSDNVADGWLPRNIRPLVLLVMTVAYLILVFVSISSLAETAVVALEFGEQIKFLLATIVGFYFGSRGTEKVIKTLKDN